MPIQVSKRNKQTQDYYLQPPWDPGDWEAMVGSDPTMAGTGYSAIPPSSLTNADIFQTGAALGLTRPEVQAEMERGIKAGVIPRIGTAPHLPSARKWLMDQFAPGYDPYLSALKARNVNLPPSKQELALSPAVWGRQGAMSRQMLTTGIGEGQLSTRPDIVTSHLGMGVTPEGKVITSTDPAKFLKRAKLGGRHSEIMAQGLPTFQPEFQIGPSQGPGVRRQAVRAAFTFGEMEGGGQGTYDPSRLSYFSQRGAVDIWPTVGQTEVTGLAKVGTVFQRGQQVQLAAGKTGLKDAWWNTRVLGYEDVTKTEYQTNEAGARTPYQVAGKRAVLEQFQTPEQINLQMKYGQKVELRPGSLGGLTGVGGQPLGVSMIAPVKSVENLAMQWYERRGVAGMAEALGVSPESLAGKTYGELQPQLMEAFTQKIMPSRMQEVQWPVTFHESQLPYFKGMLTGEPAPVAGQPGFYSGTRRGTAFIDEVAAVFSQSFHSKGRAYFSPEELANVRAMQPQMYKEIMHESYRQRRAYGEVVGAATATAGKEVAQGFARVPTAELQKMYIQATGAARERLGLGPAEALPRGAAAPELLSRMAQSPYGRRGMIFGGEASPLYTPSARSLQYFSAQGPDVGMEVSPYLNAVTELVGAAGTPGAEQLAIEGEEGRLGARQLQEQLATSSEAVRRSRGALARVGGAVQHLSPLLGPAETFVPGQKAGAIIQQTRQPSYGRQTFNPQLAEVNVGEEEFRRRGGEDVYHTYRSPAAVQAGRGDVDGDAIVQKLVSTGIVKEQPDGSYVNQGGQVFASRQAMVAEANRAIAAGAGDVAEDMIGYKGAPRTREQVLAQEQGRAAKTYTQEEFAGHLEFGQRMYGEIGPGFNVGTRMESEVARGDEAARAAVEAVHQRTYERAQRPAELTPGMKHLQDLARGFSFGTGGVRLTGAKGGVGRVDKGTLTNLATGGLRGLTMDVVPPEQIAALNAPPGPGRERVHALAKQYYATAGKTTDKETAFSELATSTLEAAGGYEKWATESVMGRTLGGAAASRLQKRAIEKGWTPKQLKSTIAKSGLENVYGELLTAKKQQDLFVAARRHQTGRAIEDVAEIRQDIRRREGVASGVPMTPGEQFTEDFFTGIGQRIQQYEAKRGTGGEAGPGGSQYVETPYTPVTPGKYMGEDPDSGIGVTTRPVGGGRQPPSEPPVAEAAPTGPALKAPGRAKKQAAGPLSKQVAGMPPEPEAPPPRGRLTNEQRFQAGQRKVPGGLRVAIGARHSMVTLIDDSVVPGGSAITVDPKTGETTFMSEGQIVDISLIKSVADFEGKEVWNTSSIPTPPTHPSRGRPSAERPPRPATVSLPAGAGGVPPPREPSVATGGGPPDEPPIKKPRKPRAGKAITHGRTVSSFLGATGMYDPAKEEQSFYLHRGDTGVTIKEMSSEAAIDRAFQQMGLIEFGVEKAREGIATVDEPGTLAGWQKAGMGKARQIQQVRSLAEAGVTKRVTKESLGAMTELAGTFQQSYEAARKAGAVPERLEPAQETLRQLNQETARMAEQLKTQKGGILDPARAEKVNEAFDKLTKTSDRYNTVMDSATKSLAEGHRALQKEDPLAAKRAEPGLVQAQKEIAQQLRSYKEMLKDFEKGGISPEAREYREATRRAKGLGALQEEMEVQRLDTSRQEMGLQKGGGGRAAFGRIFGLSMLPWQLQFAQMWGGQQATEAAAYAGKVSDLTAQATFAMGMPATQGTGGLVRQRQATADWSKYYFGQGAAYGAPQVPMDKFLAGQPDIARGFGAVSSMGPTIGYGLAAEMVIQQSLGGGLLFANQQTGKAPAISQGWGRAAATVVAPLGGLAAGFGVSNAVRQTNYGFGQNVSELWRDVLAGSMAAVGAGLGPGGVTAPTEGILQAAGVLQEGRERKVSPTGQWWGKLMARTQQLPEGAFFYTGRRKYEREADVDRERQAQQDRIIEALKPYNFGPEDAATYAAAYARAGITDISQITKIAPRAREFERGVGLQPGALAGVSTTQLMGGPGAYATRGKATQKVDEWLLNLPTETQGRAFAGWQQGIQQWGARPEWAGLTPDQAAMLPTATAMMSDYERERYIRNQVGTTPLAYSNRVRRAAVDRTGAGAGNAYRMGAGAPSPRQDIADLAVVDEMGRPTNWDESRALELAGRQWDVRRTQFGFTQEREQLTAQRGWMQRGNAIEDRLRPIRERQQVEDADMGLARIQLQLQQAEGMGGRQPQAIQRELFEKQQQWREQDIYTSGARAQVERGWQEQDFSRQRSMFEMQQGWQMTDLDRAIRYSTGRQRIQLKEQRERAVQTANVQRAEMGTTEERAKVQYGWGGEDREKALVRLKEEGALRRELMDQDEEANKKSLDLLRKQYEQAVERRKELVDVIIPAEREQEKLQREQAEKGLVWKEQRLALDQAYYGAIQPLQENLNKATDSMNEAWVKYQNVMETDVPTAMELAAKRGDKAWGDMLKNIQDGLAAIAKQAENVGKKMEQAFAKGGAAWPDEMRRTYDRAIPGMGSIGGI